MYICRLLEFLKYHYTVPVVLLIILCSVLLREGMTESEKSLDVTGLSNGNVTKIATLSTSLHDLNPDYGCLAGNPFEEDGAVDR